MNQLPLGNIVISAREQVANAANTEDAALWRWFCLLFEEGGPSMVQVGGWMVCEHRSQALIDRTEL